MKKMKKAVALSYKDGDTAPQVVATGKGFVADNILEKGKENKVHTYKDAELVNELTQIELGLNIPPELYHAVASVLMYIGELDKQRSTPV